MIKTIQAVQAVIANEMKILVPKFKNHWIVKKSDVTDNKTIIMSDDINFACLTSFLL